MQRHLSASKPGDAGKLFFEGMFEGADLFRWRRSYGKADAGKDAISFATWQAQDGMAGSSNHSVVVGMRADPKPQ